MEKAKGSTTAKKIEFILFFFSFENFVFKLKFLILGKISQIKQFKKQNKRPFRKVIFRPIGAPFRIFKKSEEFLALIKAGRWNEINSKNEEILTREFEEISFFKV